MAYLGIILIFSAVYYLVWNFSPDSFVIAGEVNLEPFAEYQDPRTQDLLADAPTGLLEIQALRTEADGALRRLNARVDTARAGLDRISRALTQLQVAQRDTILRRFGQHVASAADSFSAESLSLVQSIEIMRRFRRGIGEPLGSEFDLQIAQKNSELAQLSYRMALVRLRALEGGLQDLGAFGNESLGVRLGVLGAETSLHDSVVRGLEDSLRQLRTGLQTTRTRAWAARASRLGWWDFVYFSVVAATSTGFGDIVPNKPWVRILTASEILSSLVVFGFFIAKATAPAGPSVT